MKRDGQQKRGDRASSVGGHRAMVAWRRRVPALVWAELPHFTAHPDATAAPRPPAPGSATVIVPTHNDGPNMATLLARLAGEDAVAEIVVLASECSDQTVGAAVAAAHAHPGLVRVYLEERRSGKAAAVNFGLSVAHQPVVIVVSGDVVPDPGAVGRIAAALAEPGVGLAGGRPVPVNSAATWAGHAGHLLWDLHHRMAIGSPKLGEMIGLRAEAARPLPVTSVDEATFQALLEGDGWRSVYVPDAVVRNRAPSTISDLLRQRRQVHAGHIWLRQALGYTVPSMRRSALAGALAGRIRDNGEWRHPRRLAWTAATMTVEVWARVLARLDYLRGAQIHVWKMVTSTKDPSADLDGMDVGDGQPVEGQGLA